MEKLEIRTVIKYFCKKGMHPKETQEYFMETLGKSLLIAQWKSGQQSLRGGEIALRMMDGLAAPKMPPLMKMSGSCTSWLCVIGGETCEALLAKWALVLGQYNQSNPTSKKCWLVIRKGIGSIFLGMSCLAMKMFQANFTQDETWVHYFDPESKMKSKQWNHVPWLTPS